MIRVLVVDDNEAFRQTVCDLLDDGYFKGSASFCVGFDAQEADGLDAERHSPQRPQRSRRGNYSSLWPLWPLW